jgi:hypothetical protein
MEREKKKDGQSITFATCVNSIYKSFLLDKLRCLYPDSSLVNYLSILIPSTQHAVLSHFSSVINVYLLLLLLEHFFFLYPKKFFCLGCFSFYMPILYVQCSVAPHAKKSMMIEKNEGEKKKSTALHRT